MNFELNFEVQAGEAGIPLKFILRRKPLHLELLIINLSRSAKSPLHQFHFKLLNMQL